MKRKFSTLFLIALFFSVQFVSAQESPKEECLLKHDFGADLVSRYVWRGTDFGNTPSIQPSLVFTYKKLEFGAWGNYGLNGNTGSLECDLYATYSFDFGLGITLTDYYFPGESLILNPISSEISPLRFGNYFDFKNNHNAELGLSYERKHFSASAYYLFSGDFYAELGYELGKINVFAGGGNGGYTVDQKFNLCNVGISYEKELKLSSEYNLPAFGQFLVNPSSKQVHFVFGLKF